MHGAQGCTDCGCGQVQHQADAFAHASYVACRVAWQSHVSRPEADSVRRPPLLSRRVYHVTAATAATAHANSSVRLESWFEGDAVEAVLAAGPLSVQVSQVVGAHDAARYEVDLYDGVRVPGGAASRAMMLRVRRGSKSGG